MSLILTDRASFLLDVFHIEPSNNRNSTTSTMCIQIYRRCICGHREKNGPPKRCEKAKKASRTWCYVPFAGPKLDEKGYCLKKKADSFGVPEPCLECKAEGGSVNRLSGPKPIERPEANLSGHAYYYHDGGPTSQAGGAQGLAPLPPPRAYLSSPYSNESYGRVPPSRYDALPQQPQVYQEQARRPSKYENPRVPPPRPSRSTNHAPEPDNKAGKQSEKYVKKTIREAEKVSKDTRKKVTTGHSDTMDDIRARAIAKAREQKRHPEPSSLRHGGGSDMNPAYPAPLNPSQHRHHHATPAGLCEAVYPDLRHHPAMKSDVQFAVHHEAFTAGTHYDEATRRFQDNMVRLGAASHPNTHSRRETPNRDPRQYTTTRAEADRYQQQQAYAAPYGGYGVGGIGVSPLTYSPPESQISTLNVTQKLPYTYNRR